jgi:hypothetical protein
MATLLSYYIGIGPLSKPWQGQEIALVSKVSRQGLGPSQRVQEATSEGINRPGREANHSPPSSAEVKNARNYTSTPPYVFMAWCSIKHRDNFTFISLFRMC